MRRLLDRLARWWLGPCAQCAEYERRMWTLADTQEARQVRREEAAVVVPFPARDVAAFCEKCGMEVTTFRTYAHGSVLCVPCSVKHAHH